MARYKPAQRTDPRQDGSGTISWDVWALDDGGLVIPGRHKNILTPATETQAALNSGQPGSALKALLLKYAGPGWDDGALSLMIANNLNAQTVNEALNQYVMDNLGGWPVEFNT